MTYATPAWEFAADSHLVKMERLQNRVFRTIGNLPRCTPIRDFIRRSKFRMYLVYDYIKNYAGNKQKSSKIMIMKLFATLDKVKPDIENIRGLNLAAVKHRTVQVTRLPF
jgi:hypothetical protein